MRAALVSSLLIALAASTGAQDRERLEVELEYSGHTRLALDVTLGEASTKRLIEGQPDEVAKRTAVELWAAQQLAAWSGPGSVAWDPIELEVGGRVRLTARAWLERFQSVRELRDGAVRSTVRGYAKLSLFRFEVVQRSDGPLPAPSVRESLRLGSAGLSEVRRLGGAVGDLADWSRELVLVLPGPVKSCERDEGVAELDPMHDRWPAPWIALWRGTWRPLAPATESHGNRLRIVEGSADRVAAYDRSLARLATLAQEVEAGQRTLDGAVAAVDSRSEVVRVAGWARASGGASPAAVDSNDRGLAAAQAAWAASPWKARVEQALTPVPLAGIEPLAPLAPATTPAPTAPAPGSSLEAALVVAPGEHALACDLETWLRIDLKAGQTVRVEVRPEADLDLELWGAPKDKRELVASSSAGTPVESASWKAAKDGPVWLRVWKGTARFALVVGVQ